MCCQERNTCILISDVHRVMHFQELKFCFHNTVLHYLLMKWSLTLKTTIPRMTRAGIKAYRIRKSAVNLDVAPGQILSMNWVPSLKAHIGLAVSEPLELPAGERSTLWGAISSESASIYQMPTWDGAKDPSPWKIQDICDSPEVTVRWSQRECSGPWLHLKMEMGFHFWECTRVPSQSADKNHSHLWSLSTKCPNITDVAA